MQDLSRDTTLDHGTAPTLATDSAVEVLGFLRDRRAAADAAEADILRAAAQWAAMHSSDALDPTGSTWGDTVKSLAGPGAPGILEFSVLEFAAALGMSSEWGAAYLGAAIELRYRLPRVWARVMAGDLQAWRARRIAEATLWLSMDAAAHVDRHVAPVAHKIRPTAVDRLVEEAAARHDPDALARRTHAAEDRRGVHLDTTRTSLAGTVPLHGELDLPDALALDEALAQGAADLASLGNTEPLDARRATALGEMARAQLPLDLLTAGPTGSTVQGSSARGRRSSPSRPRPRDRRRRASRSRSSSTSTSPTPRSPGDRAAGPGRHHPHPRHRRDHPHLVRPSRLTGHQARHRPPPPDPRQRLRGPRPHPRTPRPARPHLRLPLVHPTGRELRHRPRPTLGRRRRDGHRQPRPAVSAGTTAPRPTPAGH